jgi:diguanylate cyclase (GGDEF)-like protein
VRLANVAGFLRTRTGLGVFLLAYTVVRIAASVAETRYVGGTGFSPWHLTSGLDVVLYLVCGWRWWPLPVVAGVLRQLLIPQGLHASIAVNAGVMVPYELILALATTLLVTRLRVHFPLGTVRDVAVFAGTMCLALPFVLSVVATALYTLGGRFTWAQAPEQFARLAAGEVTAIIVTVPVLTQLLAGRGVRAASGLRSLWRFELWVGAGATAAAVAAEYLLGVRAGHAAAEMSFVLVAWLGIRCGMPGAVVWIATAEITAATLQALLGVPIDAQIEYAWYLAVSALMGLLLGAATTERDLLLTRLERNAYIDELTNLPNRQRLIQWIGQHVHEPLVLVIVDVDDMRLLNEGIGRVAADRVLAELAERLRGGLPTASIVARLSSDEFAVVFAGERAPTAAVAAVHKLVEAPFVIDGSHLFIEASVGAVSMTRPAGAGEMLRRADLALHHAKRSSSRSAVYDPELHATSDPLLVVELHRAAEHFELVPFYQPIFRYDRLEQRWQPVGAEALLRWIHPKRGLLGPDEFIDLLERLAISERVGWNVLEASLRLAKAWRKSVPGFRVWVNLFARQALDPQCAGHVASLLEATNVPAQALAVEISERIVVSQERDVSQLVAALHELGVISAIDDFGTGGSSLSRVRDVPADVLKIDRSFVTRSEVDAKARAVAGAVVRLAAELGMTVVAEGVENSLQIEAMLEAGCEYAQGYALGHPVPVELLERIISESETV